MVVAVQSLRSRSAQAALDPESLALLELGETGESQPIEEMTVAESRAAYEELFTSLAPPRLEVGQVIEDRLPLAQGDRPYRLYRPAQVSGSVPALLFLHGGGWSMGSPASYDHVARWLCHRAGIAVLSLDYRLAPEHPFPSALEDTKQAFRWLGANAAALSIDAARIAIGGDSSGGTLAAATTHELRHDAAVRVAAQVLLYPVLTLETEPPYRSRAELGGGGYFLTNRGIEIAAERYLTSREFVSDPRVSPILEPDLSDLPPTLVVTGGFDPLRDECEHYAERLSRHGAIVEYRCFAGTIHGFISFAGALRAGREGLDYVSEWLRSQLLMANPSGT